MWVRRAAAVAVLSALVLGSAIGHTDDARKAPPQQPGAGLLEFLGSVDRLSEVNPNYLSQPDPPKPARPAPNGGTKPPQSPPPGPGAPGVKNNG
ncbi:MAG: hypothetical protein ACRETP_03075 [Steroidobacteraceae bacterium]